MVGTRTATQEREAELDIAFHSLLLDMTGSALVAGMQRVLVDFFRTVARRAPAGHHRRQSHRLGAHRARGSGIRDQDVEQARARIHACRSAATCRNRLEARNRHEDQPNGLSERAARHRHRPDEHATTNQCFPWKITSGLQELVNGAQSCQSQVEALRAGARHLHLSNT